MTTNAIEARPWSDLSIPPGEFLEEELEARGMSQRELALRTGRPYQVINEVIRGHKSLTFDTALELERVLGISASFWVNLEASYRLTEARERDRERLECHQDVLARYPVDELERLGWIEPGNAKAERIRSLLSFFGVASFEALEAVRSRRNLVGFVPGRKAGGTLESLEAWLRKGEVDAEQVQTAQFSAERLRSEAKQVLDDARTGREDALSAAIEAYTAAGVAIVVTPALARSGATGSSRWVSPGRALIQLAGGEDPFFVLLHETNRVLRHRTKDVFVAGFAADREAESFARSQMASLE